MVLCLSNHAQVELYLNFKYVEIYNLLSPSPLTHKKY